ncbi:MAG: glycosyl transferase [Phycisphaerae bacterium]|nr:MAG: glycosyl transferase [Phycisphaerae bacterium]
MPADRRFLVSELMSETSQTESKMSNGDVQPKVSVGVPVYNGERFLEGCLDALLAQTYGDFEIIISDNGSTDSTMQICRRYADRDSRIRYYRTDVNHGAAWNFNRTVKLANGMYFKWAAHDDLCAPEFLQSCVDVLDSDESVVLACPKPRVINDRGEKMEPYGIALKTDAPEPHVRYGEVVRGDVGYKCFEVFGLYRMSALKNTELIGNYPHGDGVLLARLALFGRFQEVPEEWFFPREHAGQSMQAMKDRYAYSDWFDTKRTGRIIFPTWRMFWEYFRAIGGTPTSLWQRMMCQAYLLRSAISYRRKFVRDIVGAWHMRRRRRVVIPKSASAVSSASSSSGGSSDR